MLFRPPRLAPLLVGLGAILAVLALAVLGAFIFLEAPINLSSFFLGLWVFLLLVLTSLTAWRTYCCWRLRYHLTRDALTIHWGYRKVIVPVEEIREMVPSQGKAIRWAGGIHGGIHWYAYHAAPGHVEGLGPVYFYATHLSPSHLVFLVTRGGCYGLSLESPERFARGLESCRRLGPLSRQEARLEESPLVHLPFWRDPWAVAFSLSAFLANLALFAYLSHRYPSLASFLSLHFAPTGQVDRIGTKLEIFKLPGMALVVLGSNSLVGLLLHLKERYLARLTLAVALLVQVLFWVAAVRITG